MQKRYLYLVILLGLAGGALWGSPLTPATRRVWLTAGISGLLLMVIAVVISRRRPRD
jgi:hypothetical protein